jgi:pilus assembly protein CpaE
MFSWVIVDLGLPMNDTAYAYLDQADRIAVSVLPEMVGLRNARFVVDQFRLRDYPQEKIWLVLNRATIAAGVSQDDIESRLGLQIAYSIPDDQALATHSVNRGIPLIMSRRRSALVRVYRKFVHWVLEELPEPRVAPEPARAVRLATPIARKARQVGVWGS